MAQQDGRAYAETFLSVLSIVTRIGGHSPGANREHNIRSSSLYHVIDTLSQHLHPRTTHSIKITSIRKMAYNPENNSKVPLPP